MDNGIGSAIRSTVGAGMLALFSLGAGIACSAEATAPPAAPPLAAPPAGDYTLDKAHTNVQLRVSHLGLSTYTTRFTRVDAALSFDPAKPTAAHVFAQIDSASIDMNAWPTVCVDILRGPQLLDTEKFPKIVFRSESVRMTGAQTMDITGTLELHGVTRPVTLNAIYHGGYAGIAKMDPRARIGFSARGSFKRSDFGMVFGLPPPGSDMGVGDLVDISIEAEFTGPELVAGSLDRVGKSTRRDLLPPGDDN
jgi:polyisoprenoid-binding protein YceI